METLLANDDIVSSETQLLESLIHWYKYSKNQRGQSFKNLVPLIHMSSIPDLYLKFLAEKESIEELNSFTGHQFKVKSSLDDLKRTTHFYNLTICVFSRYPDCPGTYLCYWLPFAGPWSFITSRFCFTARQARLWFSLVMPCICRSTNSTQKLHFRNLVILLFGESRRASQNWKKKNCY